MISVPQMRKELGTVADTMTDDEIRKLQSEQERLADILFDMWIQQVQRNHRSFCGTPVGVVQNQKI